MYSGSSVGLAVTLLITGIFGEIIATFSKSFALSAISPE